MESRKITAFSLLTSLTFHLILFLLPNFSKAIFFDTYKVVNVVPLTFDLEVDSNLLGEKTLKGKKGNLKSDRFSEVPKGETTKKVSFRGVSKSVSNKKGIYKSLFSSYSSSKKLDSPILKRGTGNGNLRLFFSNLFIADRKGKEELVAVKGDKLVPYLLKVRERILENWNPPYINLPPKKSRVVIELTLLKSGKVYEINVLKLSDNPSFNRSAILSVYRSEPFPPLPKILNNVSKIKVKVNFESN